MPDAIERARLARTWVERLGARVPGFRGYLERELRREVDQLLRAELARRLDQARDNVATYLRTLGLGVAGRIDRLAGVEKRLDMLANTLRHAGSGYAGVFDAVGIREEQLEELYRYDLDLVETVDGLVATTERLAGEDAALDALERAVGELGGRTTGRDSVVKSVLGGVR